MVRGFAPAGGPPRQKLEFGASRRVPRNLATSSARRGRGPFALRPLRHGSAAGAFSPGPLNQSLLHFGTGPGPSVAARARSSSRGTELAPLRSHRSAPPLWQALQHFYAAHRPLPCARRLGASLSTAGCAPLLWLAVGLLGLPGLRPLSLWPSGAAPGNGLPRLERGTPVPASAKDLRSLGPR